MNKAFPKPHGGWKIGSGLIGIVALFVILVAVNIIVSNLRLRHDFTEQRLYTLSDGSRAILRNLDEDITLKLYFSRSLPDVPIYVKEYAKRVEDLLQEYELAAGGHIRVETYDTRPDSDAEEWATRYGIEQQPTGVFAPPMYFGLVAVGKEGTEQTIPALSPRTQARLEYELTRLVTRVSRPEKPVIGLISSLPVLGGPDGPQMGMQRPPNPGWISFRELRRDYELRSLDTEVEEVPDDISMLMVVHPKQLSDATLFAIDQFLLRGGHLMVMVDPFCVADFEGSQNNPMAMMGMGGQASPSDLEKLFGAWGVRFDSGKLVADMRATTRLGGRGRVEESPIFLSLSRANLSADDLLTSQLDQVMLPYAGAFQDETSEAITFTPLLQSSADASCLVDAMGAQFGMQAIRNQLKPDGLRRVLAARLTGTFKTAFPDGRPAAEPSEDDEEAPASEFPSLEEGSGVVIVVADVDFLYDRFCVEMANGLLGFQFMQPINDNLALTANAVEQLCGHPELIGIRSRGEFARPFSRVDEIEYKATLEWQAREDEVNENLRETQRRLDELQSQKQGSQKFILSKEQEEAIETFRRKELDFKQQLKQIRKNLRRDIDRLGTRVKLINIVLMPAIVIVLGLIQAARRRTH